MTLEEAMKDPRRRVQLEGARDFLVKELDGNKCKSCAAVKLRASDTAALVGKLLGVMKELSMLPSEDEEADRDPIEMLTESLSDSTIVQFHEHQERQKTRRARAE